jgi:multidrug resistance protein, MATE family
MQAAASAKEIYLQVIKLAYPVVISTLALTLMGVTDTFFMRWVGTSAQGGVGLGGVLSWTCISFFVGTLTVINTYVAQLLGAGKPEQCGVIIWHGLVIALGFTLLLLPLASQIDALVGLFGATEEVAAITSSYAFIRVAAAPLHLVEACLTSFLRGIGDTRTPMMVAFLMLSLNIPLNYWLIFGGWGLPPLGPDGAAYATVAASAIGVIVLCLIVFRGYLRKQYGTGRPRSIAGRQVWSMLKIGLPIGVGYVLEMATWTIFAAIISHLSKEALAAHNIVIQVLHLSFMPGVAISVAATTIVGQHLGARDPVGAERSGYTALKVAMAFMFCMGLVFLIFGRVLSQTFSRDPQVVIIATKLFLMAAAFQIFDAMGMVSGGILRGAGDTRFPMAVGVLFSWFVFLPLVWFCGLYLELGVVGSWAGATVNLIGQGIILFWRVRSGSWKSRTLLVQP